MTLVITAVESEPAPVMFPPPRGWHIGAQLAFPGLEDALELPAFLPSGPRRSARMALAEAAERLAHMERRA